MDYDAKIFQVYIRIQEAKKYKQHHIKKVNVNFLTDIYFLKCTS